MESKRISVTQKNPNALFKKWLREWIEEAEKKKKKVSKIYERALDSLMKYPLTLYSGHDCAILENFGPKICQMLDERLEKHLNERLDLYQQTSYKDKIAELQRRENLKMNELVRSVEAACCTDISLAQPSLHDIDENEVDMEDIATQVALYRRQTIDDSIEQENVPADVEIPEDLLSSSADSEDSLDLLVRKYDPEAAAKKKQLKRVKTVDSSDLIRRHKKTFTEVRNVEDDDLIDLTQGLPGPMTDSPKSTFRNGTKLKKFKSFDTRNNLAGPSFASSPIPTCFDAQTNVGQVFPDHDDEDEFDRLASKYDFISSPIAAPSIKPACTKPASKLTKKASSTKLPPISEVAAARLVATQSIPEDENDELKYISIDDINPTDYNVVLLVDIQETSGYVSSRR